MIKPIKPQDYFEDMILNLPHLSDTEREKIIFSRRERKEKLEKKLQLQALKNKFNG